MGFEPRAELVLLLRLVVAGVLAAVLGWERESAHKPAGLRTHMLVGIASALFTVLAELAVTQFTVGSDPGNSGSFHRDRISGQRGNLRVQERRFRPRTHDGSIDLGDSGDRNRRRTATLRAGDWGDALADAGATGDAAIRRSGAVRDGGNAEPLVGFEPTTARLRIESSTPELQWRCDV
jgi:hypothetical protein